MERLSQSPTDPEFVQNPYVFYDRARSGGDLFFWKDYDVVCATSHAAVSSLLKDRRLGRAAPEGLAEDIPERLKPFYDIDANSMLDMEPPRHTRLRSLVLRAFTSRGIAALTPEIEALAHRLVDAFPNGEFNILTQYCQTIPVTIIARLLGVPDSAATDLLGWSNAMVAMYQARRSRQIEDNAVQASVEFVAFLQDLVAKRRAAPSDDLLSHLIAAEEDGAKLTTDELIGTIILLLNAGHEATVHAMGNAIPILLAAERPQITDACVEETLRIDPPLHIFQRWVYEDCVLFGHDFKRGDKVSLILGAANRDPAAYPDPHRFDPARSGPINTSFGGGIHFCVGAPLARLELKIGLGVLFDRCPGLSIASPPKYGDVYHFHGLEELLVRV